MKIAYDRIPLTFVGRQKLVKRSEKVNRIADIQRTANLLRAIAEYYARLIRVSILLKLLLISSRILLKQHHMGLSA